MPLSEPRTGIELGFNAYPRSNDMGTLGRPEQIIWSSILHLCSSSVAEFIATKIHGVKHAKDIKIVARNLKLYINQAHEFYDAAQVAKANTAPLIYYYSFLNLAKALCEIRNPGLHKRNECYGHGISWRPNPNLLVNLDSETVSLSYRGVWQALWESITHVTCIAPKGTKLSIKEMFMYCPEVGIEVQAAFGEEIKLITLEDPNILYDNASREAWIRFSVERSELKLHHLTAPTLINAIKTPRSGYIEVRSKESTLRTFESLIPVKNNPGKNIYEMLHKDVLGMNVFSSLEHTKEIIHSIPIQHKLPLRMPQVMVMYTILFWLGSLVRYDPHSLNDLKESHQWILIDGFMSQSRLWLLEQFEWAFYQTQTTLWVAR